jgi:hypothetical protein
MACFNPVSVSNDTVAWNLFPCLRMSKVRATSMLSLFSWMRCNARSRFNQKLISCKAVPDEGSRSSFVTFWISLIQRLTPCCSWFKKLESSTLSLKSATLGLRPSSAHCLARDQLLVESGAGVASHPEKRESMEVALTLDILKHGKRFHATVSFDTDTGLKQAIATVNDYNPLMKVQGMTNLKCTVCDNANFFLLGFSDQ